MTTASSSFEHAHHFKSKKHQYETAKVGIWLFMATEILMFGGLFVGFFIFKPIYYEVYAVSSKMLDWRIGSNQYFSFDHKFLYYGFSYLLYTNR